MLSIACIGAGVMSTAFAVAQSTQHKVGIIPAPFDAKIVQSIQENGYDPRLDIAWPNVDFIDANHGDVDLIVVGVSSQGIPWAIQLIRQLCKDKKIPIVLLTKGLIQKGKELLVISDYVALQTGLPVMAVTGPCIAKSLAHQYNTKVVCSAKRVDYFQSFVTHLSLPFYEIVFSQDYIGAGWCSALKNVYAILISRAKDNLNMRSALFAQALNEMAVWVEEQGGDRSTVYGLSGVGDLYVTCQGGRNGQLGEYLADGLMIDDVLSGPMKGITVEGVDLALMLLESGLPIVNKPLFQEIVALLG